MRRLFILITCLFGPVSSLYAEFISINPEIYGIDVQAVEKSDIIVIARLQQTGTNWFEPGEKEEIIVSSQKVPVNTVHARASIEVNFKGSPGKEIKLTLYVPSPPKESWDIAVGRPVLLLLKHIQGSDAYELVEQPNSWLTLPNGSEMVEATKGLTAYLSAALPNIIQDSIKNNPDEADLTQLESGFKKAGLNTKQVKDVYIAQSQLALRQALATIISLHIDSPELRKIVASLWSSDNSEMSQKAMMASLTMGDSRVIDYCIGEWKKHSDNPILRLNLAYPLLTYVRKMQQEGNIEGLVPYLKCDIPSIRAEAMQSIGQAKNPTYLPQFIAGLDDDDNNVKYYAMSSIYYLDPKLFREEKIPAPLIALFNTQPDYYTSIWKKWLADGGLEKIKGDLQVK